MSYRRSRAKPDKDFALDDSGRFRTTSTEHGGQAEIRRTPGSHAEVKPEVASTLHHCPNADRLIVFDVGHDEKVYPLEHRSYVIGN